MACCGDLRLPTSDPAKETMAPETAAAAGGEPDEASRSAPAGGELPLRSAEPRPAPRRGPEGEGCCCRARPLGDAAADLTSQAKSVSFQ
jgi:hypothetical protein